MRVLDEDDWQRVERQYRLPRIFTGSRSGLSKAYGNTVPPESTPALTLAKLRFWGLGDLFFFWWKSVGQCENHAWIYVPVLPKPMFKQYILQNPCSRLLFSNHVSPSWSQTALFILTANRSGQTPAKSTHNKGGQREREAFLVHFGIIQRFGAVPRNETKLSIFSSRSDPCPCLPPKKYLYELVLIA